MIDESKSEDLYEILAGMDAYITDYSSAIFEAGYAHIPAFIYVDDVASFTVARGNLYWGLNATDRHGICNNKDVLPDMDLPFPFTVASNNDQLEEDILNFDTQNYNRRLDIFHEKIGLVSEGNASCEIVKILVPFFK